MGGLNKPQLSDGLVRPQTALLACFCSKCGNQRDTIADIVKN